MSVTADFQLSPNAKDLTGQVFGRLTALKPCGRSGRAIVWECRCECGHLTRVTSCNLKSGNTSSCGCLRKPAPKPEPPPKPPEAKPKRDWSLARPSERYEQIKAWVMGLPRVALAGAAPWQVVEVVRLSLTTQQAKQRLRISDVSKLPVARVMQLQMTLGNHIAAFRQMSEGEEQAVFLRLLTRRLELGQ